MAPLWQLFSQINPGTIPECEECDDAVYRELQELLSEPEPSGSHNVSRAPVNSKSKVGMRARVEKKSCSCPTIADWRNYTYDEMIENVERS